MHKKAKSQWDFGELFPPEQLRRVLTVTELTSKVRGALEKEFGNIWVTGEISNLRLQSSGHIYFTLKDVGAQLSCVLFRGELQVDRQLLQDGRKVNLGGQLTVYEPRGQYQLRVTAAEPQGLGALQAAFERLKQKLDAQGLFAQERKRPLPRFPQRIGLVTSPTGAAIRDVLHVVKRRNPSLEILLAPCRVQGESAGAEIAAAIALLNEYQEQVMKNGERDKALDLILVTRGGGSLEDLWAFSEEVVARSIFASGLPVVSAVGHEIDFTISDFVADVRAATPSAAAEIITEGVYGSLEFVASSVERLGLLVRQQLEDRRYELEQVVQRLARVHPGRRLDDCLQRLDDVQSSLSRCTQATLRSHRLACRNLVDRLGRVRPGLVLRQRREVLEQAGGRLRESARHRVQQLRERLGSMEARLRLLGPEQVLARGYSITFDAATGKVCRDAAKLRIGQPLKTRLQKGEVRSKVE